MTLQDKFNKYEIKNWHYELNEGLIIVTLKGIKVLVECNENGYYINIHVCYSLIHDEILNIINEYLWILCCQQWLSRILVHWEYNMITMCIRINFLEIHASLHLSLKKNWWNFFIVGIGILHSFSIAFVIYV
jgi:hypothetical protein